jgi:selenocysteine lyase/cysteine desulfurase
VTTDFTAEFPLVDDLIYLNHAAVGPWPRRTARAIESFTAENLHHVISHYRIWVDVEQQLRQRLVDLIGARGKHEIALLKNTSEALSTVAFGLPWQAGDNVVLPAGEFPSNRACWEVLAQRDVEVRLIDLDDEPEDCLLDSCDGSTRVLTVSSVDFATGSMLDLERLGAACKKRNILFCVDAIQSLGVVPMDVDAWHIDFLAGGSHKWLLAPEGVGFLYCREELLEKISPLSRGWRMGPEPFAFEQPGWGPAESARRFECGTLNTLGMIALEASLSLLQEIGIATVHQRVADRCQLLIEGLQALPDIHIQTPTAAHRRAGILSFSGTDTKAMYRVLRKAGVLPAMRNGLLRLSPHFHTPTPQLQRVCELLGEIPDND